MNRSHLALTMGAILLTSSNIALAETNHDHFEILLMGGLANLDADDMDSLIQTNEDEWESFTGQVGLGYVYFFPIELETGAVQWFPSINPQVSVYFLGGDDIEGEVSQQRSEFNDIDYTMELQSTRAMFDLALTLASIDWFSIYAIGGAGVAWNKTKFSTTHNQADLDTSNSSGIAYEFGGGATAQLRFDLAVSVEYLYTRLTDVGLADHTDPDFDNQSSEFDINSQAILLGLRLALN